jgi:hypothetical protein
LIFNINPGIKTEGGGIGPRSHEAVTAYKAVPSSQLDALSQGTQRVAHHGPGSRPGKDAANRAFVFSPDATVNPEWNQATVLVIFGVLT